MNKTTIATIKTQISKHGKAYYFRAPKPLVDCQILRHGQHYTLIIQKEETPTCKAHSD